MGEKSDYQIKVKKINNERRIVRVYNCPYCNSEYFIIPKEGANANCTQCGGPFFQKTSYPVGKCVFTELNTKDKLILTALGWKGL